MVLGSFSMLIIWNGRRWSRDTGGLAANGIAGAMPLWEMIMICFCWLTVPRIYAHLYHCIFHLSENTMVQNLHTNAQICSQTKMDAILNCSMDLLKILGSFSLVHQSIPIDPQLFFQVRRLLFVYRLWLWICLDPFKLQQPVLLKF